MLLHDSAASGNVKASLAPWKVLVRASDHRQEAAQQRDGGASAAGDSLSAAEAYAVTDLFFSHLLVALPDPLAPAKGTAGIMLGLAEMQTDEGHGMLLALQRVWRPHSAAAGGSGAAAAGAAGARTVVGANHCSTAEGALLLQALGVAAKRLQAAACSGTEGRRSGTSSSGTAAAAVVGLPYVALRRLALALLHALHEGGGRRSWELDPAVDLQELEACRKAVAQVRHMFSLFQYSVGCSAASTLIHTLLLLLLLLLFLLLLLLLFLLLLLLVFVRLSRSDC